MKRILIASLFSLAAAPVLANASFNDFPEQGKVESARPVAYSIAPSFNDQPDLEAAKVNGTAGVAGRAATDIAQSGNTLWTPAY
jgi:hypothetical protein